LTRTAFTLPAATLLLALTLAGCTTAPAAPEAAGTAAPSATPSRTPVPELLTTETAGARYLSAVCVSNKENAEWYAAAQGSGPSLDALHTAAAEARDANRASAQILDDPMVIWPDAVAEDIATVRDSLLTGVSIYEQLVTSPTLEALNSVVFTDVEGSAEAGPRIRLRLNLSADTGAGCDVYTQ
jgi:hypothetical protein